MDATERLRDCRGPMIALSFLVFVGAFTYRFNALLGSLSGFDGDHFIYYLGSSSVLRGERPLRDFVDAGLQGAWPALTYELSALAQRLGGELLLSEAVLCAGAVALSATVMFRTASSVSGVWAGVVVTLLSVATSTRLYGYHKVLVSSVAVALLLHYARAPSVRNLWLMAAWSAVAFLFRHDYLVYLALATVCLIMTLPGLPVVRRARLAIAYAGLTGVLLLGPVYSVHRFVGLGSYLSSNIESTRREAGRTDLEWPAFESVTGPIAFFENEVNAVSWLVLRVPAAAGRWNGGCRSRATAPSGNGRGTLARGVVDPRSLRSPAESLPPSGKPRRPLRGSRCPDCRSGSLAGRDCAGSLGAASGRPGRARGLTVAVFLAVNTSGSVWQELATTGLRLGLKAGWRTCAGGCVRTQRRTAAARARARGTASHGTIVAQRRGLPAGVHTSGRPDPGAGGRFRGAGVCGAVVRRRTPNLSGRLLHPARGPGPHDRASQPAVRADRAHARLVRSSRTTLSLISWPSWRG